MYSAASPGRPVPARTPSATMDRNVPSPSGSKRGPATPSRVVRKGTPPTAQLVSLPDTTVTSARGAVGREPIPQRRQSVDSTTDEVEDCSGAVAQQQQQPPPPPAKASPKPAPEYDDAFESDDSSDAEAANKQQHVHAAVRPQHPSVAPGRPQAAVSSSARPVQATIVEPQRPPPPQPPATLAGDDASLQAPPPPPAAAAARARPAMNINISKKELIGRGSFGNVYKAIDEDTDRIIAVKEVLLAETEMKDLKKQVHQLEREIRVMQKLCHPNIVQYLGAKRNGAQLHIYMEYVPGGTLTDLLRSFGKMKEPQAARYTYQLLLGLEYLHDRKIAHRDLKGENLYASTDGTLKIGDFGTSKELQTLRMTDSVAGTPNFMAPEVISCAGHSIEADIWSVGCVVIQMLTGHPPFHSSDNHLAVMFKVSKGEIEGEIPTDISAEASDFIHRCTAREPADRWTCKQLLVHPWIQNARARSAERQTKLAQPLPQQQAQQQRPLPSEATAPAAPSSNGGTAPGAAAAAAVMGPSSSSAAALPSKGGLGPGVTTPPQSVGSSAQSTPVRTPQRTPPPASGSGDDRRQNSTPTRSLSGLRGAQHPGRQGASPPPRKSPPPVARRPL